jgi:hypothetical protein
MKTKDFRGPSKSLSLTVRRLGGPRRGNARHRAKYAGTSLHPAGPPEAHNDIFVPQAMSLTSRLWRFTAFKIILFAPGRAAGGQRQGFVRRRRNCSSKMRRRWRARRKATGQRRELVEVTSPRRIKPPRCTSAELFFSCCGSVAALPA